MKKGKDISATFGGLFLVHQNIPGKTAKAVSYQQHILFIPLQGEVTIEVANDRIAFGMGQMLYLPPNTQHSFSSSEKLGERLIVMANKKLFANLSAADGPVKLPLNQFIKELLFYLLLHPKSKNAKNLASVFVETLQESLNEASAAQSTDLDHLVGRVTDKRVREVLTFIRENLAEDLKMNTVAKQAGLSGRNLNRLVIKETGQQPKQWLIQFRIEKARELLKVPGASVTDVAYAVGYNSLGQFISAFRARTGQLPSEYLRHG